MTDEITGLPTFPKNFQPILIPGQKIEFKIEVKFGLASCWRFVLSKNRIN